MRTLEEKVDKLMELTGLGRYMAKSWMMEAAAHDSYETFYKVTQHSLSPTTWDVHTEAAFSPLYRLL